MSTTIRIDNATLIDGAHETFLTADAASGVTTISVASINQFAVNQILLIGAFGSEGSEIVKTDAVTGPTGETVTLAAATQFAHDANTPVYIIGFDQYELSHAATATGGKTLLTTALGSGIINIDAELEQTTYSDSEYTSGFYFVRKKETIGNTFSTYSDPIPVAGFGADTVSYMIEQALRENRMSLSNDLTQQDCVRYINEGVRLIQGKQVRWPEHMVMNYIAGQTQRGDNTVTLPTNIYDANSNRSIVGVRIGNGTDLQYLDPKEFEYEMEDVLQTTVRTQAIANDTSLLVTNSYDLPDTGTVQVFVNNVKYSITYTSITRDDEAGGTASLDGIPASGEGSITVTIPVGTTVWKDVDEGAPYYFTVRNSNLEFYPLPDAQNDNENVYLDYATVATQVDSDADVIDVQRFDMLQDYLTWRMRMKIKNDGKLDLADGYYTTFKEKLNDAIRTSKSPYTHKMKPKINGIRYRGSGGKFQYESSE